MECGKRHTNSIRLRRAAVIQHGGRPKLQCIVRQRHTDLINALIFPVGCHGFHCQLLQLIAPAVGKRHLIACSNVCFLLLCQFCSKPIALCQIRRPLPDIHGDLRDQSVRRGADPSIRLQQPFQLFKLQLHLLHCDLPDRQRTVRCIADPGRRHCPACRHSCLIRRQYRILIGIPCRLYRREKLTLLLLPRCIRCGQLLLLILHQCLLRRFLLLLCRLDLFCRCIQFLCVSIAYLLFGQFPVRHG